MFNVFIDDGGGPNLTYGPGSTDILITYVYDVAFIDGQYGYVFGLWYSAMLVVFWRYMKQPMQRRRSHEW